MTYKIIRYFRRFDSITIKTGLTLEQAQNHCNNEETSSDTCLSDQAIELTLKYGNWFDGYVKEE